MGKRLIEFDGTIYTESALEELSGHKTCTYCRLKKPLSDFDILTKLSKNKSGVTQKFKSICRICHVEITKKYYRKVVEKKRLYQKEYRKENRDRLRPTKTASGASYRAKKTNATPPWLTKEDRAKIRLIFKEREQLSQLHGKEYHVDHILPLNSKLICGLHVPWNLRVICKMENLYKGAAIDHALLSELYFNYSETEITPELLQLISGI